MKILFLTLLLSSLFSCSGLINRFHRDFDRGDGEARKRARRNSDNTFSMYRSKKPRKNYTPRHRRVSTKNRKYFDPSVKRRYKRPRTQKRSTADDLNDNESSGSLWTGDGKDSFLFSQDKEKHSGDIILINVMASLSKEITLELKRSFPSKKRRKKSAPKESSASSPPRKEPGKNEEPSSQKAKDRISSIIIEEIRSDHVLLKGRKNILYKNHKRLIEIQALINRRVIDMEDSISSDEIIESSITVIR